ncbi:MAG TPA: right-handed parallel beta-helix repeat-containing protein [Lysobacter sp.]
MIRTAAVTVLLTSAALPHPARAETYDTCTGFIDTLPATITTQGTWCLRHDLSTAITSGDAINIATNNVTIDCNDFKVGGLAAGNSSQAKGINAGDRLNVTVRRCNIRGFYRGINISGGAGHLVEDNRLDNNLYIGIRMTGENNVVQRNRVFDTGGYPFPESQHSIYGIWVTADVIDNLVDGVFGTNSYSITNGIVFGGPGVVVRGNRVRSVVVPEDSFRYSVGITGPVEGTARVEGNHVYGGGGGWGIEGGYFCANNSVANVTTPYFGCTHSVGNVPN